jgi:hypothetical protein
MKSSTIKKSTFFIGKSDNCRLQGPQFFGLKSDGEIVLHLQWRTHMRPPPNIARKVYEGRSKS